MIGRLFSRDVDDEDPDMRGFDAFDLRLGDLMRGERATLGKSLLDVERELKIKANYVAAIENADPSVFDTPGFIPAMSGPTRGISAWIPIRRSGFCAESGFSIAHGMSAEGLVDPQARTGPARRTGRKAQVEDPLISPNTPFLPANEGFMARLEPGAIGSVLVLVALITAIGYGGWSVLRQVQQVQLSPVENTPAVLADLDPLSGARRAATTRRADDAVGVFQPPATIVSRLYRPRRWMCRSWSRATRRSRRSIRAMWAHCPRRPPAGSREQHRDGTARGARPGTPFGVDQGTDADANAPRRRRSSRARPRNCRWSRCARPGCACAPPTAVIFEGIMNAGDTYTVPATEDPPTIRIGPRGRSILP